MERSAANRTIMENRRSSFEFEDLLSCGRGEMFLEGPQLPLPPMLMFDRISEIAEAGGEYGKGLVRAVLDLLDGYLEVTDAILSGRLRAWGAVQDIVRMFSAIEIILDASSRVPTLQALAERFKREKAGGSRAPTPMIFERSTR